MHLRSPVFTCRGMLNICKKRHHDRCPCPSAYNLYYVLRRNMLFIFCYVNSTIIPVYCQWVFETCQKNSVMQGNLAGASRVGLLSNRCMILRVRKMGFWGDFIESVEIYLEKMDNGRMLKQINFNCPVYYDGEVSREINLPEIRLLNEIDFMLFSTISYLL